MILVLVDKRTDFLWEKIFNKRMSMAIYTLSMTEENTEEDIEWHLRLWGIFFDALYNIKYRNGITYFNIMTPLSHRELEKKLEHSGRLVYERVIRQ
jgi:hypothetical protein